MSASSSSYYDVHRLKVMKLEKRLPPESLTEPRLVHRYLVNQAIEELPSCTSTKYAEFVQFCLNDKLPLGLDKDQKTYQLLSEGIENLEDIDSLNIT